MMSTNKITSRLSKWEWWWWLTTTRWTWQLGTKPLEDHEKYNDVKEPTTMRRAQRLRTKSLVDHQKDADDGG
jgi:hypothetical protein